MSEENIKEKDESEYEYVSRYGNCIYCGQSRMVEVFEGDLAKASSEEKYVNLLATEKCECQDARTQRHIKQQTLKAKSFVQDHSPGRAEQGLRCLCGLSLSLSFPVSLAAGDQAPG